MSDFTFTLVSEALDLWNDALVQIGREELTAAGLDAATSDQSDVERICDRNFHKWVKYVLRQGGFRSIEKRYALSTLATNTEGGFLYKFTIPSDFLRLNYIFPTGYWHFPSNSFDNFIDYQIENGSLLTNVSGISIGYNHYPAVTGIADAATVTSLWNGYIQSWSETLRETIVAFLAHRVCFPLKKDRQLAMDQLEIYRGYLMTAKMEDATQKADNLRPDGPLIMARGHGSWWW